MILQNQFFSFLHVRKNRSLYICVGIRRPIPRASSFPQSRRRYARPHSHSAKERARSPIQGAARHGPGRFDIQRRGVGRNRQTRDGPTNGRPWSAINFGMSTSICISSLLILVRNALAILR